MISDSHHQECLSSHKAFNLVLVPLEHSTIRFWARRRKGQLDVVNETRDFQLPSPGSSSWRWCTTTHFFSIPCGSGGASALKRGGVPSALDCANDCAFLTPMAQFHGQKLSWSHVYTLDVVSGTKRKVKWNNCPTLPSFYHRREDFAPLGVLRRVWS